LKATALLAFMPGATNTANGPELAPAGIVMVIDVALQALIVTNAPFNKTTLLPCEAPNPEPEITTWLPIDPLVAERLVMIGAGAEGVLIET
jgi:hypothetical protein